MGASTSSTTENNPYDNFVREEFRRLTAGHHPPRKYLALKDLMKLGRSEFIPVDFSHIGVLFVLDQSRDGTISLEEIFNFVSICRKEQPKYTAHDFGTQMHAYCTLRMWTYLNESPENKEMFIDWVMQLIIESVMVSYTSEDSSKVVLDDSMAFDNSMVDPLVTIKGVKFIDTEAVAIVHDLLGIQTNYDIGYQTFLDQLQQVGEEMGLMELSDSSFDEYVPLQVIRDFIRDFIGGFLQFMEVLDFTAPPTTTSPNINPS